MSNHRTRRPYTQTGPVRIAVMGTHAVGKTTLAKALAGALDLPLIPEQAREVARDMGLTPATVPVDRFCEFQQRALESHYALEVMAENGFVADRTVFDYGVYFDNPPTEELKAAREYIATKRVYNQLLRLRALKYSFIIYVPKMFDLVADGERHGEIAFQNKIQADIESKVLPLIYSISEKAESRIPVCKLSSDGPSARVAEVLAWVATQHESSP